MYVAYFECIELNDMGLFYGKLNGMSFNVRSLLKDLIEIISKCL